MHLGAGNVTKAVGSHQPIRAEGSLISPLGAGGGAVGTEPRGRSLPPLGHPVHDGWWRGLYLNFEKWLENDDTPFEGNQEQQFKEETQQFDKEGCTHQVALPILCSQTTL